MNYTQNVKTHITALRINPKRDELFFGPSGSLTLMHFLLLQAQLQRLLQSLTEGVVGNDILGLHPLRHAEYPPTVNSANWSTRADPFHMPRICRQPYQYATRTSTLSLSLS